ncbi:MAG: F0F1 ATP synthase subunit A [Flavobacteriales bacterium]|nr:F0F1 ATP synthase subunit A [Flavobacteriales bacterium]
MSLKRLLYNTFLFLGALCVAPFAMAQEGAAHGIPDSTEATAHSTATAHEEEAHGSAHAPEKFNAGKLIMEHIGDAHSWHLWGHTSLPLPVILWTDKGMECFSSGKLMDEHHHAVPCQGAHYTYLLEHEKIQAVHTDGSVNETAKLIDFSLTKNAATLIAACVLLLVVFIGMARGYAQRGVSAPKGLAKFLEPIVLFVRDDIAKSAIGEKHYKRFLPYLLTLFFFIWSLNLIGLIPIFPFGANVTGNIVTPLVLAAITFLIVTFAANRHYWRHIFAMPGIPAAVLVILTPIEIMGHFIRPIVLMVRLFANIMAGHIVLLVFFCLIFIFSKNGESLIGGYATSPFALAFTIFINCLELLVGALQAYVFTLLTSIYIGTAVAGGHDDHHH